MQTKYKPGDVIQYWATNNIMLVISLTQGVYLRNRLFGSCKKIISIRPAEPKSIVLFNLFDILNKLNIEAE